MKAIVMNQRGGRPQYTEDFPEPVINSESEVLLSVRAASIKQLDKAKATGTHYSATGDHQQAKVIGVDGVGVLADGTRVYAIGTTGMVAEKAIAEKNKIIPLPDGIDNVTAAALPNAVAGSAMALLFGASLKAGETVLINGATGFTGRVAIQIAKHYGAKRVIITGRNEHALQSLLALGADEIVSLKQDDEQVVAQLKRIHANTPIDIIIDYLWGHPAELILKALKGQGSFTHRTRFVSVGSMAGDAIQLSSQILRSVDLQLLGSGLGSWTKEEMQKLLKEIIPAMFQLAIEKKLQVDTTSVNLQDIEHLWDAAVTDGKRLVVVM